MSYQRVEGASGPTHDEDGVLRIKLAVIESPRHVVGESLSMTLCGALSRAPPSLESGGCAVGARGSAPILVGALMVFYSSWPGDRGG